jgi:hypothetical protein
MVQKKIKHKNILRKSRAGVSLRNGRTKLVHMLVGTWGPTFADFQRVVPGGRRYFVSLMCRFERAETNATFQSGGTVRYYKKLARTLLINYKGPVLIQIKKYDCGFVLLATKFRNRVRRGLDKTFSPAHPK